MLATKVFSHNSKSQLAIKFGKFAAPNSDKLYWREHSLGLRVLVIVCGLVSFEMWFKDNLYIVRDEINGFLVMKINLTLASANLISGIWSLCSKWFFKMTMINYGI